MQLLSVMAKCSIVQYVGREPLVPPWKCHDCGADNNVNFETKIITDNGVVVEQLCLKCLIARACGNGSSGDSDNGGNGGSSNNSGDSSGDNDGGDN